MKLFEQADRTNDLVCYSWILDGVSGKQGPTRKNLEGAGWKWIKGFPKGCYVTNDFALAKQTGPHIFGKILIIESNGTHTAVNAPMYEEGAKKEEYA